MKKTRSDGTQEVLEELQLSNYIISSSDEDCEDNNNNSSPNFTSTTTAKPVITRIDRTDFKIIREKKSNR